jgi:ribosomal protein L40E
MAKKSLGYVQLEWTCPNCDTRNPGARKICLSCGMPQPEDVAFEQPAQEKIIVDEAKLAQAKAGPDIHCYYCGARNPANAQNCTQCGASLTEGEARTSGNVLGAHRDKPAQPIDCPACGTSNLPNAPRCVQCGASLTQPKPAASPPPKPTSAKKGKIGMVGIGVAGLLFLLICAAGITFVVLSMRTSDTLGKVESARWTRSVVIEGLVPVQRETWQADIPVDAVPGSCVQKVHHTQDEPAPNAQEICGTPYTVDSGSGFGEVVQDCQYQVYADWCEYTVQEWQKIDEAVLNGTDFQPQWPVPALTTNQRAGAKAESYHIVFTTDEGDYTYQTSNADIFARCQIGSQWVLKVNTFNAVTGIEPAR